MNRNKISCLLMVVAVAASMDSALAGPMHADWTIAQDGSPAHKLLIEGDPKILDGTERIELLPGDGIFAGLFVNQEPGWESLEADEPPDRFTLLPGSNVSLKRLSFDAGFSMYDPFTGTPILETDGSIFPFGAAPDGSFHIDLLYVGDGPIGSLYSAAFQLVDPSGLQADSDPFTLGFVVVPEPTTAILFGSALLALWRRRPRHSPLE
jgi:hypothetical protein